MSNKRRFSFVVNPAAARGKAKRLCAVLHNLLRKHDVEYEINETAKSADAAEIARESASSYDVIVAVGGDGTANEVANGVIGSKATMGVIPAGSGNDFALTLGMSKKIEDSLNDIVTCRTKKIDSGLVKLRNRDKKEVLRRFVNSFGIGFDAVVAYESQRIRRLKGIPLYMVSVVRSLRKLKLHDFDVTLDGKRHRGEYYLVCVGNGNREGGGFYVTPGADPTDGIFKVCTVDQVSLSRALRILPKILKGKHGDFDEVRFFDSRRLAIGSERPFVVHCDGEILGTENEFAEVEMQAESLQVVVGRNGLQTAP